VREHGGPGRLVRWRRVAAGHRTVVAALVATALVLGIAGFALAERRGDAVRTQDLRVAGTPEPGQGAITLDATLYLPRVAGRVPAVLIAHGFGGSKTDVAADARWLASRGYAVVAYTARGFGRSGGLIHMDSPDYEVKDAQRMLDVLAARPEVRLDAPGDPRVGVVGGSYGGALALLLAGTDRRVDAIVPSITWNDLRQSLFPQFAVAPGAQRTPAQVIPAGGPGVFKRMWAADLLGGLVFGGTGATGAGRSEGSASAVATGACGRVALDLCLNYARAATTGVPSENALRLLAASSPARVLDRITAPTLLVQGETDSLFPLSEADANAVGIAAHGTPVKVAWVSGGHDAGLNVQRMRELTIGWLDRHLRGTAPRADGRFEAAIQGAAVSSADSEPVPELRAAPGYPGLPGRAGSAALHELRLPLSGAQQTAVSPPGGAPAAVSTLPGLAFGGALGASDLGLGGDLAVLPGQSATFDTAPLTHRVTVVGGGQVTVHITSTSRDVVLFCSLLDVANDGSAVQPRGLVAPVHLTDLPPEGRDVTIALPAIALDVSPGHRLRVALATTDAGYAVPQDTRAYRIRLAGDRSVQLPQVAMTTVGGVRPFTLALIAAGMLAAVLLGGAILVLRRRKLARADVDRTLEQVPLALSGLGKTYPGGLRAVSDLSFRVEVGQVVGLLGPNGAGKTTVLRMVMGLIHPSEGEVRVFGRPVTPGAAVLSRVGSFVEGPGFLPHLSGLDNLQLYWRATGRPAQDACLDLALDVAGLGDDVHRRVRTYSHGMKQRLAIAQAMLGLPDLLVLDEPTNGLDPPQIRQMRDVLARYAASGRTVVVSSHLLAEVEQTCTHVVVMHQGALVAQGPVEDIVAVASTVAVDVDDPARAVGIARRVAGVHDVVATPAGLLVRVARPVRADLVGALVNAGLRVERVAPQRGLEEAFLTLVGDGVAVQTHQQARLEEG
jgi:ABC-2 type transport system ATP-binding protein